MICDRELRSRDDRCAHYSTGSLNSISQLETPRMAAVQADGRYAWPFFFATAFEVSPRTHFQRLSVCSKPRLGRASGF